MRVVIGVPKIDQGIESIAKQLEAPLDELSEKLSQDFGGEIEHLCIDVELSALHSDERPSPWPFRFQKRVSPPRTIPKGMLEPIQNIAHYSIRPNLTNLPPGGLLRYVLMELYASTEILEEKVSKFPGFRVRDFRQELFSEIENLTGEDH